MEFDPTNGMVGDRDVIRAAVLADQQGWTQSCPRDVGGGGLGSGRRQVPCTPCSSVSEPEGGDQAAAVGVARKLTAPCGHMLTKEKVYVWARRSHVAHKTRSMDLQAGQPQTKGNKRGAAYAISILAQ